jgi:ureidoglycolate hydrolase
MALKVSVSELIEEAFNPFGRILRPQSGESAEVSEKGVFDFFVPYAVSSEGWQIGYLFNRTDSVDKLERHPTTPEVFCPLSGISVFVVSRNPADRESITGFNLIMPIVISPGVWHAVISPSGESEMLIVENQNVTDDFFELSDTITF